MPTPWPLDAPQRLELAVLVGDAEVRSKANVRAEFTEELGTERVNRSALDPGRGIPKAHREPVRNLIRGLVRECERADAGRVDSEALDQEADALGETVRLARAGTREDK